MKKIPRKRSVTCTIDRDLLEVIRSVSYVSRQSIGDILSAAFVDYQKKYYSDVDLPKVAGELSPGPRFKRKKESE